jgi:peptidyl-prolyl cis-trans isomerase C
MAGTLHLRSALLGMALTGLAAFAQTPATPPPKGTTPAPGTVKTAVATPAVSPTLEAAKVNGEAIYEQAVLRALDSVPPARQAEERPRLMNYLIDNLLVDQSLRAAGYKIEATEVEKRVTEMKAEFKKVGKEFNKMLDELKVNDAELRHHIAADLRWYKYANAQATDKVLTDLFTTSKDMFDGSAVKARHILIAPAGKDEKSVEATIAQLRQLKKTIEAEVDALVSKLPAGTDKLGVAKARTAAMLDTFGKYAKDKSECPTKNNGGDVGWFQKAGFIVLPFSQAAFGMQPFQISDAVKTPFGYHLIMVTEKRPGKDVKFDEVKEIVKEVYFDRLHDGLAAQLRQKATITIVAAPK